jgi:serine/threonine protein phosphatase PrpC
MPEVATLTAFAGSHPGLRRENNEDRCHADAERGIFFVIDGVGGQAAGDKAAEIAQAMLLARLERETGSVVERIREAITLANNEIHRAGQGDPRWTGMACVLTVAIVRDNRVTVGHVGDTRLYKLRDGAIRKVTRDHSPVGDREDRGELSESEAMRHPRRNEIYRDVGSAPHSPADEEFIDVVELAFEPDSALLLCTDGLSDLVSSTQIADIAAKHAGDAALAVEALLAAANEAGGKDNISAVFVVGEQFAAATAGRAGNGRSGVSGRTRLRSTWHSIEYSRALALLAGGVLGIALVLGALAWTRQAPILVRDLLPASAWPRTWVVSQDRAGDFASIHEALERAHAGDTIRVEPGEYAERLILVGSVSLVSTVPHGAVIVAPAEAPAGSIAVELHAGQVRFSGFRIAGDAKRPLAVGIRLRRAGGEIDGVEISGTRVAGIEIDGQSQAVVRSSYIHDNAGFGVVVGQAASPKLLHNVIADNGRQMDAPRPGLEVHETAKPVLFGNIIVNNGIDVIRGLSPAQREEVARDNIVGRPAPATIAKPAPPRRSK